MLCDYFSRHLYEDLAKVKELVHYVKLVTDDATPNALTIALIMKATKNDKPLHEVTKLARQNNCHKALTFMEYIEKRNNFKHFLKTDPELTVDDDFVLKSNRIVIPSDLQNHVFLLAL